MVDEEKLTAEDLANDIPDDILDDINESPATYEVWVTSEDNEELAYLVDTGYIDVDEARKSFEFFSSRANCEEAGVRLPTDVKHFYITLEMAVTGLDNEILDKKEIL
jgi:hypothetical protein